MVQDIEDDNDIKNNIYLFYSVKDDSELIGYKVLNETSAKSKKFKFIPWNSRKKGYLTTEKIYDIAGRFRDKEFFLCGPSRLKEGIIKELMDQGVPDNHIHEEAFDFR